MPEVLVEIIFPPRGELIVTVSLPFLIPGCEAHVASVVDSLLELVVSSAALRGGEAAQEWHVFLARVVGRQPSIHVRFWQRLAGLCIEHLKGLAPNQLNGIAALLAALSTLRGAEKGSAMVPDVSFPGVSSPLRPPSLEGHTNATTLSTTLGVAPLGASSGPATLPSSGLLRDAMTWGLLNPSSFAAAVRLCCAFVVSALKLTGRVRCRQQPQPEEEEEQHGGVEEGVSRGTFEEQECARPPGPSIAPPDHPIRSLAVQVDAEVLHFLQWAVQQRALQGVSAVPCFAELSPAETEDLAASVKVESSPPGRDRVDNDTHHFQTPPRRSDLAHLVVSPRNAPENDP